MNVISPAYITNHTTADEQESTFINLFVVTLPTIFVHNVKFSVAISLYH